MNRVYDPVEHPASSDGPAIVDSMALLIKALENGTIPVNAGQSSRYLYDTWLGWAGFAYTYTDELEQRGISYLTIPHNQPPIDFEPGKNRVSLFDDHKSPQYETALLKKFGVSAGYAGVISVASLMKGRSNIDPPYVLKDPTQNKGFGKILVENTKAHRLVMDYLNSRRKADSEVLVAEPFYDSPSNYNSIFRITMTPGGTIHGAAITRSLSPKNSVKASGRDSGRFLAPLVDSQSPYFINAPRIASNIDSDKTYIGLDFPGRWYELATPTETDQEVLADYGIDPDNPVIPKQVLDVAAGVGRVLGPGIGAHIGIDLMLANGVHLLETNCDPEYTSINRTILDGRQAPSRDQLRDLAFRTTIEDLSDGVFAQTEIAS